MPQFPQHAALEMLLEQGQFEACRMVAEKMIEESVTRSPLDGEPTSRWQERDLELASLHLLLSKALFGLHEHESAAIKADMAALLARKATDLNLYAEAVHLAGVCHGQAGSYRMAVQNFTQCLAHADGLLRAKAFHNRGHTHARQGAYAYAVPDYKQAISLSEGLDQTLSRASRINLAWALILLKHFDEAEEVLKQLGAGPGADDDPLLQAQIAHDRLHIAHLQGKGREALEQAVLALRQVAQKYPHVRARIALSAMSMAADHSLPEEAFITGLLAKRLAAQANRPDIDQEASRRLRDLEVEVGTDCLVQSLQKTRQIMAGTVGSRRAKKRGTRLGGVG